MKLVNFDRGWVSVLDMSRVVDGISLQIAITMRTELPIKPTITFNP